ncbi:CheR family methyltransferase [Aquabacterium sp. A08]|uniref:CheR family methyltransferase n=1 Tax=Aquabacterium sp. A08 TaxID=2718532 RepID=UPI0014222B5C|nr:CheR family methyltransferase [Aquabacterium sp. A08]NIC41945.1 methyltransferase domain-containing protein [Aquabacterium sp. A08]NIC41988.1 methyltransferase domain-containing protein [Aquabacterium sp. A08]
MAVDDDSALQSREFAWTPADFTRIQQLIYRHAGISLHDGKQAMVYSRIARRLRDTGHGSFRNYLDWLEQHGSADEWQEFVNALTTNLTSFFRENHHFVELARLLKEGGAGHEWKVWCSAASTGEEPYSIAITLADALGLNGRFRIWASDIDTKVLQTASRGVYKLDGLKNVSPDQLRKYFLKGTGHNSGLARVRPELQKHIQFFNLNLIEDSWALREEFDVVFCRNVMIYFDNTTQRQVLARIHRLMKPKGTLFVGHAENFSDARSLFALRGKTVYEKV